MTLYKWSVSNVEKYFYHPRTPRKGSEAGMDDVSPQNIIFPMNWNGDKTLIKEKIILKIKLNNTFNLLNQKIMQYYKFRLKF